MVKIPDTWSDRVPRNIAPKRQVQFFHNAFHQLLTEHGFFCAASEMPEEKRPSAQELVKLCRYYRLVDRDLLQVVECALNQVFDALHSRGFSRYVGTGGHIGVNVFSLYEPFDSQFHYGFVTFQQRIVHFQFPGMEKGWYNSFLNLFGDNFSFAMDLEKQLFVEETLPWLDQMTTPEKQAQWRMETYSEFYMEDFGPKLAIWSQLKLRRWKEAETCIRAHMNKSLQKWVGMESLERAVKEEYALMESILDAIAREDIQWIDSLLEDNRKKNLEILSRVSGGIDWEKIICP